MPESLKIVWDKTGEHLFETGTDHGVIYPQKSDGTYDSGEAWNGLTGVTQSPSGADTTNLWADNIKYASLRSAEDFGFTIEAYTYPAKFEACNGTATPVPGVYVSQQVRKAFGFSYRTLIGNEVEGYGHGYKLHLVYGATASPSEKAHSTVNDSPDAVTLSWECETTPVAFDEEKYPNLKPTAHLEIDSTKVDSEKLKALETILYGTDNTASRLPLPSEVLDLITGE